MDLNLSAQTLHFKKPACTSRGSYSERNIIVLTLTDKAHPTRIGLGECAPLPDLSCDRDAYTHLSDVAVLVNKAFESGDVADFLRPYPALLFALESALYDFRQTPTFYNTPFARSEEGIPTNGLVWMSAPDEMLRQVKQKICAGFHCIKLKIGANQWDDELTLLQKIRSCFSKNTIQLRVDANGAFSPEEAPSKLEALAKLDIHSIEQPIAPYQWKEMEKLCRETPIPIALDEELIGVNTLEEKRVLLDTIKPQYLVLKPSLHGGFSGTLEWVAEAQHRHIGTWLTSALESNIGLRNIALLAGFLYGPAHYPLEQGLGTGLLFTDNIEMDVELRGVKLWRCPVEPVE